MGITGRGMIAAAVCALAGVGSASQAAPIRYEVSGACGGGCNAGDWFEGVMTFDRSAGRVPPLFSSDFTDLAFSVDQGPLMQATNRYATGFWSSGANDDIEQIAFNAGSAVLPQTGWSVTANLSRKLDGTLSGILILNNGGACTTAGCDAITSTLTQSHFEVVSGEIPGPPPVPLPPALGLALAGAGALAGASRLRRRG